MRIIKLFISEQEQATQVVTLGHRPKESGKFEIKKSYT